MILRDRTREHGAIRFSFLTARWAAVLPLLAASCMAGCTGWSASSTDLENAYLWSKDGSLVIQSIHGDVIDELSIRNVRHADINVTAGVICAVDATHAVKRATTQTRSADTVGYIPDALPLTALADKLGNCLYPLDPTHIDIAGEKNTTFQIDSPEGAFEWAGMDYANASDTLAIVGVDRFTVVSNVSYRRTVSTVKIHGEASGLIPHSLRCCAKLSPDGKTLYAIMIAASEDDVLGGITSVGAFDTATGELKRVYVPHRQDLAAIKAQCAALSPSSSPDRADCEFYAMHSPSEVTDGDGLSTEMEVDVPQFMDVSPDGRTLYVPAFTGHRADAYRLDNEEQQLVAIDTATGRISQLPFSAYGAFRVLSSGKYLVVENATTLASIYADGIRSENPSPAPTRVKSERQGLQLYALPEGRVANDLPGDVLITPISPPIANWKLEVKVPGSQWR